MSGNARRRAHDPLDKPRDPAGPRQYRQGRRDRALAGSGEAKTLEDVPEGAALGGAFRAGRRGRYPARRRRPAGRRGAVQTVSVTATRSRWNSLAKTANDAGVTMPQMVSEITDAAAAGQPYTGRVTRCVNWRPQARRVAKVPGESRRDSRGHHGAGKRPRPRQALSPGW